jgi:hypothetical protein
MRLLILALGIGVAVIGSATSAVAQNYPWCALYGGGGDNGQYCGFTTIQQCQATVSGGGDFCQPNTQYVPPSGPRQSTRVQRRYPY